MKYFFRKNKESGFTLITVLMVLIVLSVLGLSINTIASNSTKQSVGERDDQSVYYIAEASVTKGVYEIEGIVNDVFETVNNYYLSLKSEDRKKFDVEKEFYSKVEKNILNFRLIPPSFERSLGNQPSATLTITRLNTENPQKYRVESQGTIGRKKRTVSQEITISFAKYESEIEDEITIPAGMAVFARDKMEIYNGTINGNLVLDSIYNKAIEIKNWPTINGEIFIPNGGKETVLVGPDEWIKQKAPPIKTNSDSLEFPLPKFPEFPKGYKLMPVRQVWADGKSHNVISEVVNSENISMRDINITDYKVADYTIVLDDNYEFNNIKFNSNRKLTFDIGDRDVSIVVNRIEGVNGEHGNIYIKGSGTLTMYVKDNIQLKGADFNTNGRDNLFIYLGPSSDPNNPKTFKKSDYGFINAAIFAADANIELTGSAKFTGNIVTGGKLVKVPGGTAAESSGTVVYAPNAEVEVVEGGTLKGIVVSKKFRISGGATVTSGNKDFEDIPFFPDSSSGEIRIESNVQKLPLREM